MIKWQAAATGTGQKERLRSSMLQIEAKISKQGLSKQGLAQVGYREGEICMHVV